jgi:hypothetical protein
MPAGGPAAGSHAGKTLFQRNDQRIAKRREAEDREQDEAGECKPPAGAREAGQQQKKADDPDRNDEIGRDCEETNNLGDDEEHAHLSGIARAYFFFHAP